MTEVLEFLQDCKSFFIATTIDGKPKVRPFGFIMKYEEKLYFVTGNQKPFFKQIQENPEIEICGMNKKMEWVRLNGKAVVDPRLEVKQKAFETSPRLIHTYKTADSPVIECFYIDEGEASFFTMKVLCQVVGSKNAETLMQSSIVLVFSVFQNF